MNKAELIEKIANDLDFSKTNVEKVVNKLVDVITTNVSKGQKINLVGLGSFEKVKRKARMGINPSTKEKIKIPAKFAPKFKSAKGFKDLLA